MPGGAWKSGGHFPEDQPKDSPYKGKKSKASYLSETELRDIAYDLLLEGGTRHQIIRTIHRENYENSWDECEQAYYNAAEFLRKEQIETREILLDTIQATRLMSIGKAARRGQFMAMAALLRDAGAVIGEAEREQQSTAVELKLTVQPPPDTLPRGSETTPGPSEPINVTPVEPEEQKEEPTAKVPRRIQTELFPE